MQNIESIVQALWEVIRLMVDYPRAVSVIVVPESTQKLLLRVYVDPRDSGKVIGRQGRTARALRVLLENMSTKLEQRVSLDIDV
jgi:predicted RNA-binding protein YlqC (UPF0109 family)